MIKQTVRGSTAGMTRTNIEVSATVDGLELSPGKAKKLFQVYGGAQYISESREAEDIQNVQIEQRDFQMEQIEKDLKI